MLEIKVNELYPHPQNPRKDVGDVSELADSIKNQGIFQNLTVIKGGAGVPDGVEGYTVIIGHRRLAASKLAGIETVPCSVVEMDEKQQVATMLLENMQRTDLTAYEQAQGFQMMLDLGETQKSIAEKTGFSAATVSQRLQLIKLDQTLLEKASAKQISIVDLNKLNKIDDIKKRNSLLKLIGTSNFDYEYKKTLENQNKEKAQNSWRKVLLEAGLTEIKYSERYTGKYSSSKRYYIANIIGNNAKEYVRADDEKYFAFDYGNVYFSHDLVPKKKTKEEIAAEKLREENNVRIQKIKDISKRAYELRRDFILSISDSAAKKLIPVIIEMNIRREWDDAFNYYYVDYKTSNFTDDEAIKKAEEYSEISKLIKDKPYESLLRHTYALSGDNAMWSYVDGWGNYDSNERLDIIYDFLIKLGYQMSDEEKQLKDGTHELFKQITE